MATLLFAAAGSAIGAGFGGTILGLSGAVIGQAIGATIGQAVDSSLLMKTQKTEGPRLDSLDIQTSTEGSSLPTIDGRAKVAGTVIWATRLEEVKTTKKQGGKGGPKVQTTEYSYYANFAVALLDCTGGPVRHFGRVWADGELLDMTTVDARFYYGTEDQLPDPLIVAKDGAAPAYCGVAYVVFERMPINDYGNRIPNMAFEIWGQSGEVEDLIRGVDLIPASTEWGYSPTVVEAVKTSGGISFGGSLIGQTTTSLGYQNATRFSTVSDWKLSLDQLQGVLPECGSVALVVSWFGTDLRAGHCKVEPRIEYADKTTKPRAWSAAGLTRTTANLVSQVDGSPAYGSTPDDQSVIDAIRDLKARGLRVVLYPFIMMDVPPGNTLPDPEGGASQPAFPWRGRITTRAADGTVAAQISAFAGTALPSHFSAGSGVPVYSGPNEWTYRRFLLHLAALARNAGGVDAFLIGSELRGLTTASDTAGTYPFVNRLVTLAGEVSAMLPTAQISYAADWSEYHSHRTGGEVYFHLDPLWASPHIDFVGIDNYLPLSDWRPGIDHADYDPDAGVTSVYDLPYLKGNIEGGEYWDWYYASDTARRDQDRTPIQDLGYGEPWVFRQKAIRDWHGNAHHNRPGGVRSASATTWVPGSKPVWFTEIGCPAVDLGTNQPNVFVDPKSSESFLPYFSRGVRDDFMPRQYLRATLEWWRDNGGSILSLDNIHVWAWDARPWPEFPQRSDLFADAVNWRFGHWLNGRAGGAPAAESIARRLSAFHGFDPESFDLSRCYGQADGYYLPDPISFRAALQPWETACRLDASEVAGVFTIASRASARKVLDLVPDDLVENGDEPLYTITRKATEDLPRKATVRYSDSDRDYETGAALAMIRTGKGEGEASADLALVSDLERMASLAEIILRTAAESKEAASFTLPPSAKIMPGHVVSLTPKNGRPRTFIVEDVVRGDALKVTGSLYIGASFAPSHGPIRPKRQTFKAASRNILPAFLDLPLLPGQTLPDYTGWAAFHAQPWPGGADLYRSADDTTGFSLNVRSGVPTTMGETAAPFAPGTAGLWSNGELQVVLYSGGLVSRPEIDVLAGANSLALEHAPGEWEVLQFTDAQLNPDGTWTLTGLLRCQLGTDGAVGAADLPAGARVVVLDDGFSAVTMTATDIGKPYFWKTGPAEEDPADPVFQVNPHTYRGIGRRPYSPCHLKASVAGGNLILTWIRRTRAPEGDDWPDSGDVPLGETFERYRVEIGPEGAPLASAEVSTATATIAVGSITGAQEIRVAQISETFGPGTPARLPFTF